MINKKLKLTILLFSLIGIQSTSIASIYEVSFHGWFTIFDSLGNPVQNSSIPTDGPMKGWRTPVTGIATWDDVALVGTDDVDPFPFLGGTMALDTVHAVAIGDGFGGSGTLVLGNTLATWTGFITVAGIPINNVGNLGGLFDAIDQGLVVGDVITGGNLSASNDTLFGNTTSGFFTLPLGLIPFAATSFNVTPLNNPTQPGDLPSGGLPLTDDGVPGSPILATMFAGYSGSFDLVDLTVISINPVPVPASIWLFGSGMIGLLGLARHRKHK